MKKLIHLTLIVCLLPLFSKAQWPANVTIVNWAGMDSTSLTGDLSNGAIMEDLSWAWNSSNACFPGTQSLKFRGNHLLYAVTLPPKSIMIITVNPVETDGDFSLYGYMMGKTEFRVVPNLPQCITCEADHKWDRPIRGKIATTERKIQFQNPTMNTYNIVIGVAGPKDITTGQFNLKIKLKL